MPLDFLDAREKAVYGDAMMGDRLQEIAALETLEAALQEPGHFSELLQRVLDSIQEFRQAVRASLVVIDDDQIRVLRFVRSGPGWPETVPRFLDEMAPSLTTQSLRGGGERPTRPNDQPILVTPLGYHGKPWGAITVVRNPGDPDFSEEDADQLRLLAVFVSGLFRTQVAREKALWARADADLAAQSKVNFLSNLSHELRTPLNGILGFSRLLGDSPLEASQHTMVASVLASGERLQNAVDNLLELATLETGQFQLDSLPFSPRFLLEALVEKYSNRTRDKAVTWKLTIDGTVPGHVTGDPVRLSQAWEHLLSNAHKFTPRGSITVHLRADRGPDQTYDVFMEVEDTGIGMDTDRPRQEFSPFHQEDSSLTRKFGGSGLGLALCDRLVRSMGGGLSLVGEPGVGTKVKAWVRLPG